MWPLAQFQTVACRWSFKMESDAGVIVQILADLFGIVSDVDVEILEVRFGANTGSHQDGGRGNGTRGKDDTLV